MDTKDQLKPITNQMELLCAVRTLLAVGCLLLAAGCGVTKSVLYPGSSQTPNLQEKGVELLGDVTACQGAFCSKEDGGYEWPMSLPQPPPAYTYQRANQKKAAKHFNVPEEEIVVGEIAVGYRAEMIGTIRGWEATAPVGRKINRGGP
ncbi:MAG: hypothetical protein M3Q07_09855 [Pseudobdellovibrionaceae bacterium]|nr:hypothetical protein [Pseudobdellovibrionaceae bacterium]